jgi:hypothetical protein
MEYSKNWMDFYDSYGIKDDGKSQSSIGKANGCEASNARHESGGGFEYYSDIKIWNVYMTELLGGSIDKPTKLVTEGAKICVPILMVVPPENKDEKTFTSMFHFGSYEPHQGLPWDTELQRDLITDLVCKSIFKTLELLKVMIANGLALARLRKTKVNVYIMLGCEYGNTTVIEDLFDDILKNNVDIINVIYHDSFKTCTYEYGHNSIVNAIVFPCGSVQLNISRYNYRIKEGRLLYHKHSINNIYDGTFHPSFYVISDTNDLCVPFKLHPQDQEFLILDMDIDSDVDINNKRIEFVKKIINRIYLFRMSSFYKLDKIKIIDTSEKIEVIVN